jgi:hypothetical protein
MTPPATNATSNLPLGLASTDEIRVAAIRALPGTSQSCARSSADYCFVRRPLPIAMGRFVCRSNRRAGIREKIDETERVVCTIFCG